MTTAFPLPVPLRTPERHLLGWESPCLPSAARWIIEHFASEGELNLNNVVCALPTSRAMRRLTELLVDASAERALVFTPPELITVGQIPELIVTPSLPPASRLERELAWKEALNTVSPDVVSVLMNTVPDAEDVIGWAKLGDLLDQIVTELASACLRFEDVASSSDSSREHERWSAFAELHLRYLARLEDLGRSDPHENRFRALLEITEPVQRTVIVVGAADPNQLIQRVLSQIQTVHILVFAPSDLGNAFTEYGALIPERWIEREIDLHEDRLLIAENEADQAERALEALSRLNGNVTIHEVVFGACDQEVIPFLLQQTNALGIAARSADGAPFNTTPPAALLHTLTRYLESRRTFDFATLLRHPDLSQWVHDQISASAPHLAETFLIELDKFHTEHLSSTASHLPPPLSSLVDVVNSLIAPLSGAPRPLGEWAPAIASIFTTLYGRVPLQRHVERERIIAESLILIRDALVESFSEIRSPFSACDALRLLAHTLSTTAVKPEPVEDAIEILGWLELLLDDVPVAIVTGFNEGVVPESMNGDLFLPNAFRTRLGLPDNARRLARDVYALSSLAATKEELFIVLGRHGHSRGPLMPSRLLSLCSDERLAQRISAFYAPTERRRRAPLWRSESAFKAVIPPRLSEPFTRWSVSALDSYLRCPYRFYLSYVLRLSRLDDRAVEMDARLFGTVLHEVLDRFAQSEERGSRDGTRIARRLDLLLEESFRRRFGSTPLPAVALQKPILQERLRHFASWQAARATEGWVIERCEYEIPPSASLHALPGCGVTLSARVDRIDRNLHTGEYAILDYKTGDRSLGPEESHREKGSWKRIQLPLYRALLAHDLFREVPEDRIQVGYIVLGSTPRDVGERLAHWPKELIDEACGVAAEVVARIRAGEFWPPAPKQFGVDDPFAVLCPPQMEEEDEP